MTTKPRAETLFLSKIIVVLRKSILDPQGKAVEHAIGTLNVASIRDVRIGKYIEMKLAAKNAASARAMTEDICKRLLANPVMEDSHFEIEKL